MMRMAICISALIALFLASGCFYEPWRNESYQCEDSQWVAPHNYEVALQDTNRYNRIVVGDVVVVPFLAPSGELYEGRAPYHIWFQAFRRKGEKEKLTLSSVSYTKSTSSERITLGKTPVILDLSSGYAAHTFKDPMPLEFAKKELAVVTFRFELARASITNTFERTFTFRPILQKGSFRSVD